MMPLSVAVSLALANPLVPKGAENLKFFVVSVVAPPSRASLQPSLSESKSKRLGIPSPSISTISLHEIEISSISISGIAEAHK